MMKIKWLAAMAAALGVACLAHAQNALDTSGTMVVVPAYGEVRQANDEAVLTLMIEEQDRDKAAAASRVNQKMKEGAEIVRREDVTAILRTRGYYTYPVYPDERQPPQPRADGRPRQASAWRVGQYLEVTTRNLGGLPKTVAAAQKILTLNGLQFRLTEASARKLDQKRIEAAYRNLTERIDAIARTMGRNPADAVLDTVDFEGSGAYAPQAEVASAKTMARGMPMPEAAAVEEPSFEPGETTLQMRVVGRVRFR